MKPVTNTIRASYTTEGSHPAKEVCCQQPNQNPSPTKTAPVSKRGTGHGDKKCVAECLEILLKSSPEADEGQSSAGFHRCCRTWKYTTKEMSLFFKGQAQHFHDNPANQ